jgi:Domain of unknown function (DUF929)
VPKNQQGSGGKAGKTRVPQHPAARPSGNRKHSVGPQSRLEARSRRNRWIGYSSIAAVIVVVAAFVLVKAFGGSGTPSASSATSPAAGIPIAASITHRLASIPLKTLAAAKPDDLTSPSKISDPPLTADGKPDLLYIGAEFCPICATERWAMYVALSKFGTFSPEPGQIHSAVSDGDIQTLTFYKTTFISPYLAFTPVETTTNQPSDGYYVTLETPTKAQQRLWSSHTSQSFPWLDFGGKMQLNSAQYDPSMLEGEPFQSIAADVGNNSTIIGADIDASAAVLIRTICTTLTGNKPADVCSAVGRG